MCVDDVAGNIRPAAQPHREVQVADQGLGFRFRVRATSARPHREV